MPIVRYIFSYFQCQLLNIHPSEKDKDINNRYYALLPAKLTPKHFAVANSIILMADL